MWILNSTDSLALKDIISKKPEILAGSCNNKLHIRCVSTHPAKQPSAAVFWRGYHKLLHYSPHKTSAPPLLPRCHQQRQSEGASDPHSPASSAGTQWVLLPLHKHRQQQEKMQTCRLMCEDGKWRQMNLWACVWIWRVPVYSGQFLWHWAPDCVQPSAGGSCLHCLGCRCWSRAWSEGERVLVGYKKLTSEEQFAVDRMTIKDDTKISKWC